MNIVFIFNVMMIIMFISKFHFFSRKLQISNASYGWESPIKIPPTILLFAQEEKTEDPTHKKLQDARKKGQVAKSVDLNSVIILIVVALLIGILGNTIFSNVLKFLKYSLGRDMNMLFTRGNIFHLFIELFIHFFQITGPIFFVIVIIGVLANVLQTGFMQSTEALKPSLNKLNPIEGFKRIFSKKAVFDFSKTFLKLIVSGVMTYSFIKGNLKNIFGITQMNIHGIFPYFKDMVESLMLRIAFVLGILAIIDFMYQKYDFKKNLKMSKHEIKEEYKQMEGDPKIKSQRKQKQRELAMSRMMAEVPEATVIVTNPTHLAIALKYDGDSQQAPRVIGKGADHVAKKIREIGKEKEIPIIENKPLARVLYKKIEIGEEIPMELYQAVAEILAIVYQMKEKKNYSYR